MYMWLDQINRCSDCDACLEVCPTYMATGNLACSPKGRLKAAREVIEKDEIAKETITAFYNCPKCAACEAVCPEKIWISKIVLMSAAGSSKAAKAPFRPTKRSLRAYWKRGIA